MKRLSLDPFLVFLTGTVGLAALFPCRGDAANVFGWITDAAITLLFFLHGAKLSREALLTGAGHWRLHLLVTCSTFVLFPVLGLAVQQVARGWLDANMSAGILYLCLLPSTVQSSIALTAIARGNVSAAVCSAALSNVAGIFITPLLVSLLMGARAADGAALSSVEAIALKLLLPFIVGHFCRPLLLRTLTRHKTVLSWTDRGSILLVVYTAFSAAIVQGLWRTMTLGDVTTVLALDAGLLAVVLGLTTILSRILEFSKEDEIAIVFCGSKKSLASGVPMATVLFPPATVGPVIIPLMLFHQIQLMVCAVLARRYYLRDAAPTKNPLAQPND